VVDGLLPLLDDPSTLSAEQRSHLFSDVLLPLLHPEQVTRLSKNLTDSSPAAHHSHSNAAPPNDLQPLLARVFFDIFHGVLTFLPYPETSQACTRVAIPITCLASLVLPTPM
jgi:hypothetical protein